MQIVTVNLFNPRINSVVSAIRKRPETSKRKTASAHQSKTNKQSDFSYVMEYFYIIYVCHLNSSPPSNSSL